MAARRQAGKATIRSQSCPVPHEGASIPNPPYISCRDAVYHYRGLAFCRTIKANFAEGKELFGAEGRPLRYPRVIIVVLKEN
jgi:hypothetical protein